MTIQRNIITKRYIKVESDNDNRMDYSKLQDPMYIILCYKYILNSLLYSYKIFWIRIQPLEVRPDTYGPLSLSICCGRTLNVFLIYVSTCVPKSGSINYLYSESDMHRPVQSKVWAHLALYTREVNKSSDTRVFQERCEPGNDPTFQTRHEPKLECQAPVGKIHSAKRVTCDTIHSVQGPGRLPQLLQGMHRNVRYLGSLPPVKWKLHSVPRERGDILQYRSDPIKYLSNIYSQKKTSDT